MGQMSEPSSPRGQSPSDFSRAYPKSARLSGKHESIYTL